MPYHERSQSTRSFQHQSECGILLICFVVHASVNEIIISMNLGIDPTKIVPRAMRTQRSPSIIIWLKINAFSLHLTYSFKHFARDETIDYRRIHKQSNPLRPRNARTCTRKIQNNHRTCVSANEMFLFIIFIIFMLY